MSIEPDVNGITVNELDLPGGENRTERLGTNLWAIAEAGSCVVFSNEAIITMSIAELEELVRVAVRAGILNLAGGRS